MKYLLVLGITVLSGCTVKPVGHPRCWDITAVITHDYARVSWYYLKLKDSQTGQVGHLDTSIFRPYAAGDKICVQKYSDGGISSVKYTATP